MNLQEFMEAQEKLKSVDPALSRLASEQERLHHQDHIKDVLRGLRRCWRDEDPGKYGEHWFLVKTYSVEAGKVASRYGMMPGVNRDFALLDKVEKFWALEIVDDAAAAQRGRKSRWDDTMHPVPLGALADAKQADCPECSKSATVVGRYVQVEDSPDGDLWGMDVSVLCLPCVKLTMIARRIEDGRFF